MTTPQAAELPATTFEVRDQAAWIRLDRPEAMNALDDETIAGLDAGLARAASEPSTRTVVITGSGPAFCAGADLKFVERAISDSPQGLAEFLERAGAVFSRIEAHPEPVIAAVNGMAIAGGLELMLACDLVVAAEDASFSDGHAKFGLFPGAGGATRLPRRVGPAVAKQMLFTGGAFGTEQMRLAGLVNQVVPFEDLEAEVDDLCRQLAARSAAGLRRMKRVVDSGLDMPLEDALALELRECELHLRSPDVAEGLRAFKEGRAPEFDGVE